MLYRLRSVLSAAAIAALVATSVVTTELASEPAPATAMATEGPARSGSGCRRDTASDLRWVSWVRLTLTGSVPSIPQVVPHLATLEDGGTYLEVATSLARSDAALGARIRSGYQRVLGRSPSLNEVIDWLPTARLSGPTGVDAALAGSDEAFAQSRSNNSRWLDDTYRSLVGGRADQAGRDYWLGRLSAGTPRHAVAAALAATPAGVRFRTDLAYRLVLGRPGDNSGLDWWAATTGGYGDQVVAAALTASDAGWRRSQRHFGAAESALPPLCPRVLRWMPEPGSIVRTLAPVASFGPNLATLTFDDGPNPTWTPQILDVLARYRIRATFFMVGNAARQHPDLVRRIVAEGHHVAIHTMSHPNLLTLGRAGQYSQIVGARDVVESIAGPGSVRCFRPPYGNRNATTDAIAAEAGLATIMWSRDGRDWASPGVDHIVNENLSTRYDGGRAVLLLHDGGIDRRQTVAALPRLIEALQARGYRFVQIC